jgi:hypothetical protein
MHVPSKISLSDLVSNNPAIQITCQTTPLSTCTTADTPVIANILTVVVNVAVSSALHARLRQLEGDGFVVQQYA